jgi:hypothetical protein
LNNNKAFFGEQISLHQLRPPPILVGGKRDFPDIGKVTDHRAQSAGPKGRFPHSAELAEPLAS